MDRVIDMSLKTSFDNGTDQTKAPMISIIVPVYKVEPYLRRCVDSILAQTYQNFELILADDGSPDSCGAICDEYAERDSRTRVIHQKNQGPSAAAARNNAVNVAFGDFITFIDSDDFVTEDYVEYLIYLQRKYDANMTIGGLVYCYDQRPLSKRKEAGEEVLLDAETTLIRMNYNDGMGSMAWGKLYQRDLVLKYPYPAGKLYEDLATTYKIAGDCERIAFGSRRIYYWNQREGSIMHRAFDKHQYDGIDAAKAQISYVKDRYPAALPAAKTRYMGKIVELMGLALRSENSREIYRKLKGEMAYYREVMTDPKPKKTQKIRWFAMKCGYIPTKVIFSVHEKLKILIH